MKKRALRAAAQRDLFRRVLTGMGVSLILLIGPVLNAQAWKLRWSDEFNGPAGAPPSSESWAFDTGGGGWGNKELEIYCAPSSSVAPCDPSRPNLFQDGKGNLVIRAINNKGVWTSGRMKTAGKEAFQYGRVEARMKLAAGDGFWPAFWMLGDNLNSAGWPTSGEQDIMEWVQAYGPGTTSSTVHGPGYSGAHGIGGRFTFPDGGRIDNQYHTYGVIWSKDRLQFYRDNPAQPYFSLTPENLPSGTQWVFNQPFFVLLNFAIGSGGFAGVTDSSTPSTGTVLIDYVRVYRASSTTEEGKWYKVTPNGGGSWVGYAKFGPPQSGPGRSERSEDTERSPLVRAEAGYYRLRDRNGVLASSVRQGTGSDVVEALLAPKSHGPRTEEQWKAVPQKNGTYAFRNRSTGLCLEILSKPASDGAQLKQDGCDAAATQSFVLTEQ